MKGYLDAKELESYKKEDLQELAKQLGVDAEGTKKEIATRCAAVEVDIPDESELTEEDKRAAENLENTGKKLGISLKAETDGSGGAQNVLTKEELAAAYDIDEKELCDKLAQIDYKYDETVNQFK